MDVSRAQPARPRTSNHFASCLGPLALRPGAAYL